MFRFSPRPNRAHEIPWEAWSAEAFARAERESKPILLAISAVWCHWCHVMDETTYSDPNVIAAIAEWYVPIRVDNDERPDVNARYNMGGWPTTALLAPDGTTLTGATYVPPPQMRALLGDVARWYRERSSELADRASRLARSYVDSDKPHRNLEVDRVRRWADAVAASFDEEFAGFGDALKFPQPELLESLLVESEITGDEGSRSMALRTLDAMAHGGMYDHVEGGFFRYSTTRDWSVPHFEKMAEDHAGLIRVLARVVARSPHHELRATLRSASRYVLNVLRDPSSGMFAGSQDADEEYYALPIGERRTREAPYVDRTVYADRNAALAGALVLAGASLDDNSVVIPALAALDALHDMRDNDGLLHHVRRIGESPSVRGLLCDQAAYMRALLDAHEITGGSRFLDRAVALAAAVDRAFSARDGGWYDNAGFEAPLGRLSIRDCPIVDNSIVAESLLRLSDLCAQRQYRASAERALLRFSEDLGTTGPFAAAYARTVRRLLSPAIVVRIVAHPKESEELRKASSRLPSPFVSVRTVEPSKAAALDLPEHAEPTAYVCRGNVCGAPARSAAEVRAAYDSLLQGTP